ncbi:MAG: glycerophosphodiester phosphodiesterase [Pseudohongiellaceae bacterium]
MMSALIKPRLTLSAMAGLVVMLMATGHAQQREQQQKLVIAHRGASGYLPEHTLESKAMAYAMGAHYIEQDVVMTRDNELIVLHDITLDRTTDVATRFPGRAREDGRNYAIDFTLDEIRQLRAGEAARSVMGQRLAIYAGRFPVGESRFEVPTLAEEIELVQGLNKSTGRDVGIYPEIKAPAFHRSEGKDISMAVAQTLKRYGYTGQSDKVYLQTFEFEELQTIHDTILPSLDMDIKLVQLIANDPAAAWMLEESGVARLAEYADGIGPDKSLVIARHSESGHLVVAPLVGFAHANGMEVHPYTFRRDEGQIPGYADSFNELLRVFYFEAEVDGVFTDFPDSAVDFLRQQTR